MAGFDLEGYNKKRGEKQAPTATATLETIPPPSLVLTEQRAGLKPIVSQRKTKSSFNLESYNKEQTDVKAARTKEKKFRFVLSSEKQRTEWDKKGEIRLFEYAARQRKVDLFPVVSLQGAVDDLSIKSAAERVVENEYEFESDRQTDINTVKAYALVLEEYQHRGVSWQAQMYGIVSEAPAFMVEVGLTLSWGAFGKKAAKEAVEFGIKKSIKQAIKKGAISSFKGLGRVSIGTGTIMAPRVAQKYAEKRLNEHITITDKGQMILGEASEAPATTAFKAYGDIWIEVLTEAWGGKALKFGARKIGKGIASKLPPGLVTAFSKGVSKSKIAKFLTETNKNFAFDGILAEYGEERLAAILRTATGIDDREFMIGEDGKLRNMTLFDKYSEAIFPGIGQSLIEIGAFSIFSGASLASRKLYSRWKSRGMSDKEIERVSDSMSETEREEALERDIEIHGESKADDVLAFDEKPLNLLEFKPIHDQRARKVNRLREQYEDTVDEFGVESKEAIESLEKVHEAENILQSEDVHNALEAENKNRKEIADIRRGVDMVSLAQVGVEMDIENVRIEDIGGLIKEAEQSEQDWLEKHFPKLEPEFLRKLNARASKGKESAIEELEEMIDGLGEGKYEEFFHEKTGVMGAEELRELESELRGITKIDKDVDASKLTEEDFKDLTEDLTRSIRFGLQKLGVVRKGEALNHKQQIAMARIRNTIAQGENMGLNAGDLIKRASETITDSEVRDYVIKNLVGIKDRITSQKEKIAEMLGGESSLDKKVSAEIADKLIEEGFEFEGRSLEELKEIAGTKKIKVVKDGKVISDDPAAAYQTSPLFPEDIILKDGTRIIDSDDLYVINTRQIKQTKDYKAWRKHAEENYQDKDISGAASVLGHVSFTAERLAEYMDDGIGGRMWREMIKPAYAAAEKSAKELGEISAKVRSFNVIEGSKEDRDAFLYAEGKKKDVSENAKGLANYIRNQYDSLLIDLNKIRKKIGVEPIPKRADYITHLNELSVLSEIMGIDRVSINERVRKLKKELMDEKGYEEGRAWEAAKREVDGAKGVAQYIDAKHARFDFVKKRLGDYQEDPSIIRSFKTYLPQAIQYINHSPNVAKNKAYKDVLPPYAMEMIRRWNNEALAGRPSPEVLKPQYKRILSPIRGTLGGNIILGNMGTVLMQLTSFAPVMAKAGIRNTFAGIGTRIASYVSGNNNFNQSQVKALRDLGIDMGLGNSLVDEFLVSIGKLEGAKDTAARTRHSIHLGRKFLMAIMEKADQFTVGATYEAFYREGIVDLEYTSEKAVDYANIMTGKTQANYFKEALPLFLNTFEGKTVAQFGTYSMNQFQFFKRDFGKELKLDEKSKRSKRKFFKEFMVFLTTAYIIDAFSEMVFARQPYDLKSLVDEISAYSKDDSDEERLVSSVKDTGFSYVPFLSNVKYKSMPPLFGFGKDLVLAILGDENDRKKAQNKIKEKWSFNVLLPYGGNQVRKTLQGIETTEDIDFPFVKDVSTEKSGKTKWEVKKDIDRVKSWIFGGHASEAAKKFYENRDKKDFLRDKYGIDGNPTLTENTEKIKLMSDEEFEIYISNYAESTVRTIERKTGRKAVK